jgi:hypothetical protein
MKWLDIDLHGAVSISRVVGEYDVQDLNRVPDGHYKIKVIQRGECDFAAFANIRVKSSGGMAGLGRTEKEALEDVLRGLGAELDTLGGSLDRDLFEWSDPTEF